jgi:hypothetical protein
MGSVAKCPRDNTELIRIGEDDERKKVRIKLNGSPYHNMTGWVIRSESTKNGKVHRVQFGETVASFHESVVFEVKEKRKGRAR